MSLDLIQRFIDHMEEAMRLPSLGILLLSIYLILIGISALVSGLALPPMLLSILALIAGIALLIGR